MNGNKAVVIHWDGKLLPDINEKKRVERLPILISYEKHEQLLGIPKIQSGGSTDISNAVHDKILQ